MGPLGWAALAAAVWWAMPEDTKQQRGKGGGPNQEDAMQALVRRVASSLGVPTAVALAFAEVESKFNARLEGDLEWPNNKPELYRKLVLDNSAMAHNPARTDKSAWHSYGLFQLLAPYHVRPNEHPRILLDPQTNAVRGITHLRQVLRRAGGDVAGARLAYVGCGVDGSACSTQTQEAVLARFAPIYQRWAEQEEGTA